MGYLVNTSQKVHEKKNGETVIDQREIKKTWQLNAGEIQINSRV